MREVIKLSMPKQPDFFKTNHPLGGRVNSSPNQTRDGGSNSLAETRKTTAFFDLFWWIKGVEDEEDVVAPLTSTRKTYHKFFAQDGLDGEGNKEEK